MEFEWSNKQPVTSFEIQNPIKHASVLQEMSITRSPTTKEKNYKRRLEDTFYQTSKFAKTDTSWTGLFK